MKASRSRGIRPVRQAWISGLVMLAIITLVVKSIVDMRAAGASGSPYFMLGLFPALLSPLAFVYYLLKIPVVLAMRRGMSAIARWTVSADEFRQFLDADTRVASETRSPNYFAPAGTIPMEGLEVIFSNDGVLIGDGYFPLSTTRGRRVNRVRSFGSRPPMIEFGTILETRARTSSVTTKAVRTAETLRVPVASDAVSQAEKVVRHFELAIAGR